MGGAETFMATRTLISRRTRNPYPSLACAVGHAFSTDTLKLLSGAFALLGRQPTHEFGPIAGLDGKFWTGLASPLTRNLCPHDVLGRRTQMHCQGDTR